jgi:hypothetical protein
MRMDELLKIFDEGYAAESRLGLKFNRFLFRK